jgi:predicted nucleotidyltransferase
MEIHLTTRPPKTPFPVEEQVRLRELAINQIKKLLLPNAGIRQIVLIGSSVKGSFGQYQPTGFRGSIYSDFDYIVYITDGYVIPAGLNREPNGKPFSKDKLNLAYRIKNFVEEKYDAEIFFVRHRSLRNPSICEEGERAGIPMSVNSPHPNIVVFEAKGTNET